MDGTSGSAALAGNSDGGEGGGQGGGNNDNGGAGGGEKAWFEQDGSGIDAKFHETIRAKGWKGPDDVLESYTNVEKLVSMERGGEADRILVKPKADAPPEDVKAFREKAGFTAPAKPEDYGFTQEQLQQAPVLQDAAKWFYEAGVPKDLAAGIVEKAMARDAELQTEFEQRTTNEYATLQQQMGDKFGDFEEAGRRAFKASGLDATALDGIERSIGTTAMLNMFAKFGSAMNESGAPKIGADGKPQFEQSAQGARARIETLKKDSDFQARLLSPNPTVRKQANEDWEALHKAAFPPDEKA
jgi:hypothetical protein